MLTGPVSNCCFGASAETELEDTELGEDVGVRDPEDIAAEPSRSYNCSQKHFRTNDTNKEWKKIQHIKNFSKSKC